MKLLEMNKEGIGFASPEFVTKTVERIENGTFKDSEWCAMSYQMGPVVNRFKSLTAGKQVVYIVRGEEGEDGQW